MQPLQNAGYDRAITVFSPDGRLVIFGSMDGKIIVKDSLTLKTKISFPAHTECVRAIKYSNDGSSFTSISDDCTAKVWDANTFTNLNTLVGHSTKIMSVSYSPDDKRILTSSWDGSIKVWDNYLHCEKYSDGIKGFSNEIHFAQYSSDGKRIIIVSDDETVKVWNSNTYRYLGTIKTASKIKIAQYSYDSQRILTLSGFSETTIWDAKSFERIGSIHEQNTDNRFACLCPDGKRILTINRFGKIKEWNAVTLKNNKTFVPVETITDLRYVRYSPNKNLIALISDEFVYLHNAESYGLVGTFSIPNSGIVDIQFSPNGELISALFLGNLFMTWNTKTCKTERTEYFPYSSSYHTFCYTPDGEDIVFSETTGKIEKYNLENMIMTRFYTGDIINFQYSPDGKSIIASSKNGLGVVLDARTFEPIHTIHNYSGFDVLNLDISDIGIASTLSFELKQQLKEYGAKM